jgi:small subunit ribosomal protein S7
MSRRAQAPVRTILPDPKYNNDMLAKFMNVVMKSGNKSAAERIIYGALDRIAEKTGKQGGEAIEVLSTVPLTRCRLKFGPPVARHWPCAG